MALSMIEQLLHCTIRIETISATGRGSGTGFFFHLLENNGSAVPVIITNKHVVAGATQGKIHFTLADPNGMPSIGNHVPMLFESFEQSWIPHPDPNVDLCVMLINPVMDLLRNDGKNPFYIPLGRETIAQQDTLNDLSAMEEVMVIGYPNGIWDEVNNLPIVRKGITATPPSVAYQGKSQFLIDAAIFPGSSGSPVFLVNLGGYTDKQGNTHLGSSRLYLLGVVYAVHLHRTTGEIMQIPVPTDMRPVPVSNIPNNLGIVIPAHRIIEFDNVIKALIQKGDINANQV